MANNNSSVSFNFLPSQGDNPMLDLKPLTTPEDMAKSRSWTAHFITDPARLPFPFLYDEKAIAGIPESWHLVIKKNRMDANIMQSTFEGVDGASGLASAQLRARIRSGAPTASGAVTSGLQPTT
jgi:hypothetical protein